MVLPKLREIKEALGSFFSAPYTTKFPFQPADKRPEGFRGKPRYHEDVCVGCGACAEVCPTGAITITDDKKKKLRTLEVDYVHCMNCGQCEEKCITETGITLTAEYSLVLLDLKSPERLESVQKEIVICESCGAVIGCRDHLSWIRKKLGAKAYAHPNLLLSFQKDLEDVESYPVKSRIRREDQIKEVCSKCRYQIVVEDEF